jgi:excisionase family DNA binding protein
MRTKNSPLLFQAKPARPDRKLSENQKINTPILSNEQLLDFYLGLPSKERDGMFAETARAAEIVGLSQRTIQLWIEIGLIRALLLGGKYKICLQSLRGYLKSCIEQQEN